jgi:hypothetical protein
MHALYYNNHLVGIIRDLDVYPDLCDHLRRLIQLSPDEGLAELVEIPVHLDRPDPVTVEEIAAIAEDANIDGLLDEQVHDAKGAEAASINNAGIDTQVEYLLQTMKPRELKELVGTIVAEN